MLSAERHNVCQQHGIPAVFKRSEKRIVIRGEFRHDGLFNVLNEVVAVQHQTHAAEAQFLCLFIKGGVNGEVKFLLHSAGLPQLPVQAHEIEL